MLSISINAFSQKTIQGRVLDKTTEQPIEFVSIYDNTNSNFVITNSDGKFTFTTKSDSVYFSIIGYEKLILASESIQTNIVFYVESQIHTLDEVIISENGEDNINIITEGLRKNYPIKNYKEKFYLRNVLRKNDTIIKIQDIDGIIEREGLFTDLKPRKKYSVYVTNMRKAGYNERKINHRFFSFERILEELITQFIYPKYFDLEETTMSDTTLMRIEFSPKSLEETKANGYYIVNTTDSALLQVYSLDTAKGDYTEKSNVKYRDSYYEVLISYYKNPNLNKYLISSAKITTSTELIDEYGNQSIYEATYILNTELYKNNESPKGKVSISKDVFELKKDYDATYWENHNILQLTDEMILFLEKLNGLDRKEFKVKSNIE
jgi:hypothetical protein